MRVAHVSANSAALSPDFNATRASAQELDLTTALLARGKASKLVWFLGCSIDRYATLQACQNANAVIQTDGVGSHSHYCTFGGLTLLFTFIPGATPPPYYHYHDLNFDHTTTQYIITSESKQIEQIFSKPPDSIVVDSSLWDIANWWTKDGSPSQHWHASPTDISHWCQATVPDLLKFVQFTVPRSRIALRSIPPVFNTCWEGYLCEVSGAIDEMNKCLLNSQGSTSLQLYDKYSLLDWSDVIHSTEKALGGPLRKLYKDDVHPGPELASAYMDAALKWAMGR